MKIFFTILVFTTLSFSQKLPTKENSYIAKVGNVFISEEEFVTRFEFSPALHRKSSSVEYDKREFLISLIAEKLLSQQAQRIGLNDSSFYDGFSDIHKMLLRDELYRKEISQKVQLSEKEIQQGIREATKEIFLSYFFCEREEDAQFLYLQLKNNKILEIDSSFAVFTDTITVVWGEAEPSIEKTAYTTPIGTTSPPVFAGNGFYIIQPKKNQRSDYYSSLPPQSLRKQVEKILHTRKEKEYFEKYLQQFLKNKIGYSKPEIFTTLAKTLSEIFPHDTTSETLFTSENIHTAKQKLSLSLQDTFVVFQNKYWSLEYVIEKLREKKFFLSPAKNSYQIIGNQLHTYITVLVQQELLAEEAKNQKLDTSSAIKKKITMWYDAALATKLQMLLKNQNIDIEKYIVALAEQEGVETYDERIKNIEVTPIPMMTFRILGFGGRMFEVPFLEKHIEWIGIDTGKKIVP